MSNTLTICLFRLFFFNLSWKVCFPVQFTSNLTDLLFPVCTGQVAEEKENYQTRYSNWLILPHGGGTVVVSTENWTICQYYTVTYFNHYWYQLCLTKLLLIKKFFKHSTSVWRVHLKYFSLFLHRRFRGLDQELLLEIQKRQCCKRKSRVWHRKTHEAMIAFMLPAKSP